MNAIHYYRTLGQKRLSPFHIVENTFGILYKGAAYSPQLDIMVAVGHQGAAYTTDGINWIQASVSAFNWNDVTWSPQLGLFCAVSTSGTNRVMTSSDGMNWILRSASLNGSWQSIAWSPQLGMFCACRGGNNTSQQFMTSPDGITWTSRTFTAGGFRGNSISWNNILEMFVSVGSDGTYRTVSSIDGINWVDRTTPNSNGQLVATFSHPSKPLFLILRQSGTSGFRHSYSTDGINYNYISGLAGGTHAGWVYDPDLNLLISGYRNGSPEANIYISRDGVSFKNSKRTQQISTIQSGDYFLTQKRSVFVGDDGIVANNIKP